MQNIQSPISPTCDMTFSPTSDMSISPPPERYKPQFRLHEPDAFSQYRDSKRFKFERQSGALSACSLDLVFGYEIFTEQNGKQTKGRSKILGSRFYDSELGKKTLLLVCELENFITTSNYLKETFSTKAQAVVKLIAKHIDKDTSFGEACALLLAKRRFSDNLEAIEQVNQHHVFFFQTLFFFSTFYNANIKDMLGQIRTNLINKNTKELQEKRTALSLELERDLTARNELFVKKKARAAEEDNFLSVDFVLEDLEEERLKKKIRSARQELMQVELEIRRFESELGTDNECRKSHDRHTAVERLLVQHLEQELQTDAPTEKYVWLYFKKNFISDVLHKLTQNRDFLLTVQRKSHDQTFAIFAKSEPFQLYDNKEGLCSFGAVRENLQAYIEALLLEMADSPDNPIHTVRLISFA